MATPSRYLVRGMQQPLHTCHCSRPRLSSALHLSQCLPARSLYSTTSQLPGSQQRQVTSPNRAHRTTTSHQRSLKPRLKHTIHASQRRTYFSVAEPQPTQHSDAETAILSAALARVPSHGFTIDALTLGATDAGYLPASTNLFSRGAFDLVMFHLVRERLALKDRVQFPSREPAQAQSQSHTHTQSQSQPQSQSQIEANLNALILARLHANIPYISRLPEALALISIPSNIPSSLTELARLADEILYLSGDTAVDSSWYTKRAGVAGVYASAELYMTQDTSVDFKATQSFVARRLDEMHSVGSAVGDVSEWAKFQGLGVVNVLRSWGMRI